jgi:hypothetical protein
MRGPRGAARPSHAETHALGKLWSVCLLRVPQDPKDDVPQPKCCPTSKEGPLRGDSKNMSNGSRTGLGMASTSDPDLSSPSVHLLKSPRIEGPIKRF